MIPACIALVGGLGCGRPLTEQQAMAVVKMQVFDKAEDIHQPFTVLGAVEGLSKPKGMSVRSGGPQSAVSEAKEAAALKGANALIIKSLKNIGLTR